MKHQQKEKKALYYIQLPDILLFESYYESLLHWRNKEANLMRLLREKNTLQTHW